MSSDVAHSLVKALRAVPDFAEMEENTVLAIVGASANLWYPARSTVFERGESGEALYIVLSGAVRIVDEDDQEVAVIEPGDHFGELSLLLHTTHSKTAVAAEESELMVIPKGPFQELLSGNPELAAYFRQKVEQRLPGSERRMPNPT